MVSQEDTNLNQTQKPTNNQSTGAATATFVMALVAIVLSPVPIINNVSFVLAILALIFGFSALSAIRKKRATGYKLAVAGIIIALIAGISAWSFQNLYSDAANEVSDNLNELSAKIDDDLKRSSGELTDQILANDLAVQLGSFEVKTDQYGLSDTALKVSVTNKLEERKSFSVTVEAVTAGGERISEDTVYFNDLGPAQAASEKAFQYVESDKLEALKKAEFKIIKVTEN